MNILVVEDEVSVSRAGEAGAGFAVVADEVRNLAMRAAGAANAEESASASEEMNAQAEQMKGMVDELVVLVGGSVKQGEAKEHKVITAQTERVARRTGAAEIHKTIAAPVKQAPAKEVAAHGAKEVKPDEVIPMDDKDFKNF